MATVERSEAIRKIIHELRLNPAIDKIPTRLASSIVPTFDIAPEITKAQNIITDDLIVVTTTVTAANTDTTAYTTPNIEGRDFFLTGFHLSHAKSATADTGGGSAYCGFVVNGTQRNFILSAVSVTASAQSTSTTFPFPLKIDRGSNVVVGNPNFTTGTSRVDCTFYGFMADTITLPQ